jgi:hypothetical protein
VTHSNNPAPQEWRDRAIEALLASFPDHPDLHLMLAMVDEIVDSEIESGHLVLTRRFRRRLYHMARRHR